MKRPNYYESLNYCSTSAVGIEPSIPRRYTEKPNKRTFFKKFWFIFCIILLIEAVLLLLAFFVDHKEHLTLLTCIISFLSTCLVAIFVFYFSWEKMKYEENKNVPYVHLGFDFKLFQDNIFAFHPKEIFDLHSKMVNYSHPQGSEAYGNNYFDIKFKNIGTLNIKTIRPCFIFSEIDESEKFIGVSNLHYIADHLNGIICQNDERRILLSIPKIILGDNLKTDEIYYEFIIGFCIIDEFDKVSYVLSAIVKEGDFPGNKSIFVDEKFFNKVYYTKSIRRFKKYSRIVLKY